MRIVIISDTHGMHDAKLFNKDLRSAIDPNQYNVLIHAGDISGTGKINQVSSFMYWFMNLKGFDDKIFIAGNHDMSFESTYKPKPDWLTHLLHEENLSQSDCVYLEDSEYIIELPEFSRPIKIYGSPWQPEFCNWGFNLPRNGSELEEKWNLIPDDTDILITHCPPYQILDSIVPGSIPLGCEKLKERIDQLNLLVNAFGHIHGGANITYIKNTLYVNASICDEAYLPINKPVIVDIIEINGVIKVALK